MGNKKNCQSVRLHHFSNIHTEAPKMPESLKTLDDYDKCLNDNGRVIVDFHASWRPPCRMIAPVFKDMAEEDKYANVKFVKVDVDDNEETSSKAGISCMPTFITYHNGKEVGKTEGASEAEIRKLVDRLITL